MANLSTDVAARLCGLGLTEKTETAAHTDSAAAVSNASSAQEVITNFPLPQELKDQIYSYFLHGENVQSTPTFGTGSHSSSYAQSQGTAHTYDFHTAILRANKAIGNEAKQYLVKNNTFVLVKFDMPAFNLLLHILDVPIITDKNLKHFNMHSLADLPKFLGLLRFQCQYTNLSALYVASPSGQRLDLRTTLATQSPTITITLRGLTAKTLSVVEQRSLLDDFGAVCGMGRNLKIVGFRDSQHVKLVTDRVTPKIIWLRALHWDRLDTALALKGEADALASAGNLSAANSRYTCIGEFLTTTVTTTLGRADPAGDPDWAASGLRWGLLSFDVRMSRAALNLRCGSRDRSQNQLRWASDDLEDMARVYHPQVMPQAMGKSLLHLECLARLLVDYPPDRTPVSAMRTVLLGVNGLDDPHAAHDAGVLTTALQSLPQPEPRFTAIPLQALSFHALPLRIFDSQGDCNQPVRPAGLVDWQDSAHLAQLSDEDKTRIKKMQKKRGCPISSFD